MRSRRPTVLIAGLAIVFAALLIGARVLLRKPPASIRATLTLSQTLGGTDTAGYLRAVEPRSFDFPRDHGPHHGFRTEWWYFTGNLVDASGRRFGYQFTVFRSALQPRDSTASNWRASDIYMAHFTVTDSSGRRFMARDRFARAAVGLAGAQAQPFRVWIGDWQVATTESGTVPMRLVARADSMAIDLVLEQGKPVVLNGDAGLSRKSATSGNASYYYSLTRMPTRGSIRIGGQSAQVSGDSWLDREWSTSALGPGVAGWDWFSLQLSDSTELMLYRLRRSDGGTDPFSGGTYILANGQSIALKSEDIVLQQLSTWHSPLDHTAYPARWRVAVPRLGIQLETQPILPNQELNVAVRYWEGAIHARGKSGGRPIQGRGYMELTGYGPQQPPDAEAPRRR